ncbi:MAG: nitrite reductase small subunit NirD [Telmatospirillum sp.]|nr:nitrite reductase small subunit NirD [Telmatospirillum sp.]
MAAEWIEIGRAEDIPVQGARIVRTGRGDIALFRTGDGRILALLNRCPHRGGPLSEGIVHGTRVTCPLHNWVIDLETGAAQAPDRGCTPVLPVRVDGGILRLGLSALPEPDHD